MGAGATAPLGVLVILPALVPEAAGRGVPEPAIPGLRVPPPGVDGAVRVPVRPRAGGVEAGGGLSLAALPAPGVGPVAHGRAVPRPVVRDVTPAMGVTVRGQAPAPVHVMGVIGVVAPRCGALPGVLAVAVRGPVAQRLGRHIYAAAAARVAGTPALACGSVQAVEPIVVARRVGAAPVGKAPPEAAAAAVVGTRGEAQALAAPHRMEPAVPPRGRPTGALLIVGVARR